MSAGRTGHGATGYSRPQDLAIDNDALDTFYGQHADQARALPPVAIVIAAYNEEGGIGPVISALPTTVCGLAAATIVVADGCKDGTVAESRDHGAIVCDVPVNRGQGAALRLGYRIARDGGAQYIVTTDADGQYNPAEIDSLLAPVVAGTADFVTGSRRLGSEETKDPVRRLGVRVFALTISTLTGQKISDTTFGLRAMRAEVTGAVRLDQQQYQAAELLIGVMSRGFRVTELPATIHKRKVGESKKGHNAIYGLHFAGVIARTWWRERVLGGDRRGGARPGALGAGQPGADQVPGQPAADPAAGDRGTATASAVPSLAVAPGASGDGADLVVPAPAPPGDESRSAKRT
ncbi:MAG TPA: glycosyltransferase family 2 protein [Streptosporangiaceae bacterium]